MIAHDTTPTVEPGSLYVVATPIGHLGDLSARAARVLASVNWVAAEDTRVSAPLLARLASRARLIAAHQHNEASAAARILTLLADGQTVALISDAGTPGVSDPGARIVSTILAAGHPVVPIPGPSAVTALASASGIVEGAFRFEGFLPARPRQRADRLRALAASDCPVVLFEAPHRIAATITAIAETLGNERWLVLGRELTKRFEEIHRCLSGEALAWIHADPMREKGEYVLVLAPAGYRLPGSQHPGEPSDAHDDRRSHRAGAHIAAAAARSERGAEELGHVPIALDLDQLLGALVPELGTSRATRLVERLSGRSHREVYARALRLAKQDEGVDPGGGA